MRKLATMAIVTVTMALILASPSLAQTAGSGPTSAPDLQLVDNFRTAGDINGDGVTDTAVDFTFDQPADLQGGPGNFQLVPVEADKPPLDGINEPLSGDGTETITIAFSGQVSAGDIARGFIDPGTVQAAGSQDGDVNPLQSVDVSNSGNTGEPDLVSVERGNEAANFLVYVFDEEIREIGDTSGFNVYFPDGTESSNVTSANIVENDPTRVRVTYGPATNVANAVGASVEASAVVGTGGSSGPVAGQDTNQPDEVLIAGECDIKGTPGDDDLVGTPNTEVICSLGGDDTIRGAGGDDDIRAGEGVDTVRAGSGDDKIGGGGGKDLISGQDGDDTLYGGQGEDTLRGDAGQDKIVGGEDTDKLVGGAGSDRLFGQEGEDRLFGQGGQDRLIGDTGDDRLIGGDAADRLFGQEGRDILRGGAGDDKLRGGTGKDNLKDTEGSDRLFGEGSGDFLSTQDGRGDDTADGGSGRDGCKTDSGDTVRSCP